uniref:Secreted protein n=1 Tax=Taenia asiatica TaxID=60517 RepID=A0A0R3VSM1_TAEAS
MPNCTRLLCLSPPLAHILFPFALQSKRKIIHSYILTHTYTHTHASKQTLTSSVPMQMKLNYIKQFGKLLKCKRGGALKMRPPYDLVVSITGKMSQSGKHGQ